MSDGSDFSETSANIYLLFFSVSLRYAFVNANVHECFRRTPIVRL